MKKQYLAAAFVIGVVGVQYAQADAEAGISADIGTTGLSAHVSVPLNTHMNARLGGNYLSHSYKGNTSDVDYDFKLKLKTIDALLDFYPGENAFRFTAGLSYNRSVANGTGKPNVLGLYNLNGTTYSAANAGTLNGNVNFRKAAPYVGIGWGNATKDAGWGFSSDLGILFLGKPTTSLTSSGCSIASTPLSSCDRLTQDIAAENVNLADKVKRLQYFPVVRIGATYTF